MGTCLMKQDHAATQSPCTPGNRSQVRAPSAISQRLGRAVLPEGTAPQFREAAHEPKNKPLAAAFDIARLSGRGFALHVVLAEKTAFSIFVEGFHTPLFLMD